MERKGFLYGVLALSLIFVVSGCGTAKKKASLTEEVSAIKTKLDTVESKLDSVEAKQAEVERAASEHAQAIEELRAMKERKAAETTNVGVKSTRTFRSTERIKDVQICLKNAGLYKGKINGRKNKATRRAIKEFQKANGLRADGIVGPKTWELLSKHMGEAPAHGGSGEGATK